MENEIDPVIKQQQQPVQVNWTRSQQKTIIVNVPTEKADSHFGKVTINAKIDGEERVKNDQKKQKWEFQTLKMQIQASAKKNKVFSLSLPINRGVKRSSDTKIHFLLQLTDRNALLTVVDDYIDCRMNIKGKSQLTVAQVLELQKRRLDRRRKNSYDENQPDDGIHNDPDFQDKGQEEDYE